MSAVAIAPVRTGRPPSARVTDPAYSALALVAGSMLFLGTESTVSVSTLHLPTHGAASKEGS